MTDPRPTAHDVFFSYHWQDHASVESVARSLKERDLSVFLDRWYLAPGQNWQQALEATLHTCRAVAVFVGPEGLGRWQQREKELALDRQVGDNSLPVIPVLLPGAEPALGFLGLNTWVDLRGRIDDATQLEILAAAVRGEPPGPDVQERVAAALATVSPYRGLRAFREEDAAFFFGRDTFTQRLETAVRERSFVAVVGASGSGKSSVVQAGLVPRLRKAGGETVWEVATVVPGDRPLHALAAALVPVLEPDLSEIDRLTEINKAAERLRTGEVALRDLMARAVEKQPGTERLFLLVDQWEELYTLCMEDEVRSRFIDGLLTATEAGPLTVVLTMRGDFFGRALEHRGLADRLTGAQINLGPMTRDEHRLAIEAPAEKVGLRFEAGLVDRILDAVGEEPGNLPLLEFVLTALWEARSGGQLHHDSYQAMGELRGAMATRAEEVYGRLTPEQQALTRKVMMQLVQVGEAADDTRRRAALGELAPDERAVVKELTDARLLVTGRDDTTGKETLEVAHEALIRHWERAQVWVNEDRGFLVWQQRLRVIAADWQRAGCDSGAVLRGALLAEADGWMAARGDALNEDERRFISLSLRLREQERMALESRRRRTIWVLTAGLAVALLLSMLTLVQARRADAERDVAVAGRLAAQARVVMQDQPALIELSVLLGAESASRLPSFEAAEAISRGLALYRRPAATFVHGERVHYLSYAAGGELLVVGTGGPGSREVVIWEVESGREVRSIGGPYGAVTASEVSSRVAITEGGVVHVYDTSDTAPIRLDHGDGVRALAFGPLGNLLVTGGEGVALVWRIDSGQRVAALRHGSRYGGISDVAFGSSNEIVITAGLDGEARLWDIDTETQIGAVVDHRGLRSVAVDPLGKFIATVNWGRVVKVWELKTGLEVATLVHDDQVRAIRFSRSGTHVATASDDNTVQILDLRTLELIRLVHANKVSGLDFSPTAPLLVTGSWDKTARIWDVEKGAEIARMIHDSYVTVVRFSPDGRQVATAGLDRRVMIWDVSAPSPRRTMQHRSGVTALAFSSTGDFLATASADPSFGRRGDNVVRVWNVATGAEHRRLAHSKGSSALAFVGGEDRLVTVAQDGYARVWDVGSGHELRRREVGAAAEMNADGLVASLKGDSGGVVEVWNTFSDSLMLSISYEYGEELMGFGGSTWLGLQRGGDSLRLPAIRVIDIRSGTEVVAVTSNRGTFSDDGTRLVVADRHGLLTLIDLATGTKVSWHPYGELGRDDREYGATLSADGRWIATFTDDGTTVWTGNGKKRAQVGSGLWLQNAAFSPDGDYLAGVADDGIVRVWSLATLSEIARWTHIGKVNQLKFSPTGRYLASAGSDRTIQLGLWRPGDLVQMACTRISRALTADEWRQYLGDETYRPICSDTAVAPTALYARSSTDLDALDTLRFAVSEAVLSFIVMVDDAVKNESVGRLRAAISSLISEAEELVTEGGVEEAMQLVDEAMELAIRVSSDAEMSLDPKMDAQQYVVDLALADYVSLVRRGRVREAIIGYERFQIEHPTVGIPGSAWNSLCWWGALAGQADAVLPYCDEAVNLAMPGYRAETRDSRGLARALTGDLDGAIDDFDVFVTWSRSVGRDNDAATREQWILELKFGRNPFADSVLEALRIQN